MTDELILILSTRFVEQEKNVTEKTVNMFINFKINKSAKYDVRYESHKI